ncbi:4Fe-4S binding protein [Desulfonema magnum]|uniref:4Fe-4S dicluster domain-containing protein n=1 Tax=Desulfonema magnum TaxID=45655 RepID=A0A975BNW8_9BACT|nr:4Fe-4S binding protein [Desulfonema magnum]QTA88910.1 4Fe-4S dicluster domain-containing protein [Desulfonema magnum]
MADKNVLVLGGGIAGLSAARKLADFDIGVQLIEKSAFLGGHGIQFSCKATDKCVKCGACVVEETLENVVRHPKINVLLNTQTQKITRSDGQFSVTLQKNPAYIDPEKCTGCGLCFEKCPAHGAISRGFSKSNLPFYAISEKNCLFMKDKSCSLCQDTCPEEAITLDQKRTDHVCETDAIIVATGFEAFNPESKPYGYNVFDNVITSLELERTLRQESIVSRPSDNKPPEKIAFIQCVGSRDAKLGHLWCSKICCGSSLRMAKLIRSRQPETEMAFFYMDVQTFGKDFQVFYETVQDDIRMIRAIPGDIFRTETDRLRMAFLDNSTHEILEEIFDLVVLSVGITPGKDTKELADQLHLAVSDSGFLSPSENGIFTAGTALGPMSIAETISNAGNAVWETLKYLRI